MVKCLKVSHDKPNKDTKAVVPEVYRTVVLPQPASNPEPILATCLSRIIVSNRTHDMRTTKYKHIQYGSRLVWQVSPH